MTFLEHIPSIDLLLAPGLNARLETSYHYAAAIPLCGVNLRIRHIAVGPGLFRSGHTVQEHKHEDMQIEHCLSGSVQFSTKKSKCLLQPGDGLVVRPMLAHEWKAQDDLVMLGCDIGAAGRNVQAWYKRLARMSKGRFWNYRGGVDFVQYLQAALSSLTTPTALAEIRAGQWLGLWVAGILDYCGLAQHKAPAERDEDRSTRRAKTICDLAVGFMRANCTRRICIQDIANHVGISNQHLNRLFRKHLGGSVANYFLRIRLEQADAMLRNESDMPIKQVAYACGFSRPNYFTASYKRFFGQLPRETRAV